MTLRQAGGSHAPVPGGFGVDVGGALYIALEAVAARPFPAARRWWVTGERSAIEVHAAGAARLATPVGAATRIGAGAALYAVRLAVAVSGFRPVVTLLPAGARGSVVAIVRRGTVAGPTRGERAEFAAFLARPGAEAAAPAALAGLRGRLRAACDAEGVRLRTATTPQERAHLLGLLPAAPVPPDGLVVLLGVDHDLPVCGLHAGQGLQHMTRTAAAFGSVTSVLAGPLEIAQVCDVVQARRALGVVPQVLVHVGVPAPGSVEPGRVGPEGPPHGDRSHSRWPGRPGEARVQEPKEGPR